MFSAVVFREIKFKTIIYCITDSVLQVSKDQNLLAATAQCHSGCLGLRKGPSRFNQQGQVVAMESSHYTSEVGMSS